MRYPDCVSVQIDLRVARVGSQGAGVNPAVFPDQICAIPFENECQLAQVGGAGASVSSKLLRETDKRLVLQKDTIIVRFRRSRYSRVMKLVR